MALFKKRPFFPTTNAGRYVASFLVGAIGASAMGPLYIWPALLISLSAFWVMFTEFSDQPKWKSFLVGWLYGFGFFVNGLYWIGNALLVDGNPYQWVYPLAVCGLPAMLALFPACAALTLRLVSLGRRLTNYLLFVFVFFAFEYLRGHIFTGFPWNLTGMAWTGSLPMLQILSVGGIYLLSFISVFLFSVPAFAVYGAAGKFVRFGISGAALALGIGIYGFGTIRLEQHPTEFRDDVIIDMIQPDIAQEDKWNPDKTWENYRDMLNLIRSDEEIIPADPSKVTRLLVLPETAITYHHLMNDTAMKALQGTTLHFPEKLYILTGALLRDQDGYHNSLVVLDQNGALLHSYDKSHLVPFGEYIPFQKYIPVGPIVNFSGFVEGAGPETTEIDGIPPFSPLVCYEVIFPGAVTSSIPRRPEFIVNVTNDGWYGLSAGPFQHLAHAIYRSIEEAVPVVRVANTGVSVVTDPYGRIVTLTPLMNRYRAETYLPKPAANQTLYSKF